jgi:hypothetical protein
MAKLANTRRVSVLSAMITAVLLLAIGAPTPAGAAFVRAHEWRVPTPALGLIIGGAPLHVWPVCRPGQIHATARTKSSQYAVLGVVTLHARHCKLHVTHSVTALLDAKGHRLAVPVTTPPAIDRGIEPRPDLAWDNGKGAWGFAWRGAWCGRTAAYVRIQLHGHRFIRGRLTGPQPSCNSADTTKPLVERGVAGFPGEAVQPAPLEWSSLTAQLQVSPSLSGPTLDGLAVTLTNTSAADVALSPCPLYTVFVRNARGDGGDAASNHPLRCDGPVTTVPADGSVQLNLPDFTFYRQDFGASSQNVTVTFAMAGLVPSAVQTKLV